MPTFDYECVKCETKVERNVTIEQRDKQFCVCESKLKRVLSFNGSVYSATANGGMKR